MKKIISIIILLLLICATGAYYVLANQEGDVINLMDINGYMQKTITNNFKSECVKYRTHIKYYKALNTKLSKEKGL